jgi:protein kinase-like protein
VNPERHRRAKEIYLAALDAPEAEREALLARECGDDRELQDDVRTLLEARGADTAELSRRIVGDDDRDATAMCGRTIGNYAIVRLIATGGMGSVFEAVQSRPRRTVALKILRRGLASEKALRRFEFEATLLGHLHHPGIAQVYEAGTHVDGGTPVPFFAMEFVPDARSLTQFADDQRLGTRERLDLFARVCDAVAYGHQKSVVHRDLKPDNVLVDSAGQPKIIDFGIARATDADLALTTQTTLEHFVGTLQYMSPEQCDGDLREVDVRSDVYSLGVILYELLCGCPPYDVAGASLTSAARTIREKEPPRPSTLRREVRGDLETIVLVALEKSPERRYQTAGDLARDVRRWLAGEPIEAKPPSAWTLAWRFARRHPIATTAAACVAVGALSLGFAFALLEWLALRPANLVIDGSGRGVILTSRLGHPLHEWPAVGDSEPRLAEIVERPAALGGGSLAVIACCVRDGGHSMGRLSVYGLDSPDRPLWTTDATRTLLPKLKPPADAELGLVLAQIDDYLPDVPGPEILAVQEILPYSPVAIRIFDLAGRCRYEAWHDGGVMGTTWLAPSRQLVVCGLNSEHYWTDRGVANPNREHAVVLFSLHVEDGHLDRDDFVVCDGRRLDSTLRWYEWLGPVEDLQAAGFPSADLAAPRARFADGRHALLELVDTKKTWSADLFVDEDGRIAARASDDGFKTAVEKGELPKRELLRLLPYEDLPPARKR